MTYLEDLEDLIAHVEKFDAKHGLVSGARSIVHVSIPPLIALTRQLEKALRTADFLAKYDAGMMAAAEETIAFLKQRAEKAEAELARRTEARPNEREHLIKIIEGCRQDEWTDSETADAILLHKYRRPEATGEARDETRNS